MKNKRVKQMICDCIMANRKRNVEYVVFTNLGLYGWHYPPCEGWFKHTQRSVSIKGKVK